MARSAAAVQRWEQKNYDKVLLRMPKGRRDEIAAAAAAVGQSSNAYIMEAIADRMERDGRPMATGSPATAPGGDGAGDLPTD